MPGSEERGCLSHTAESIGAVALEAGCSAAALPLGNAIMGGGGSAAKLALTGFVGGALSSVGSGLLTCLCICATAPCLSQCSEEEQAKAATVIGAGAALAVAAGNPAAVVGIGGSIFPDSLPAGTGRAMAESYAGHSITTLLKASGHAAKIAAEKLCAPRAQGMS